MADPKITKDLMEKVADQLCPEIFRCVGHLANWTFTLYDPDGNAIGTIASRQEYAEVTRLLEEALRHHIALLPGRYSTKIIEGEDD